MAKLSRFVLLTFSRPIFGQVQEERERESSHPRVEREEERKKERKEKKKEDEKKEA